MDPLCCFIFRGPILTSQYIASIDRTIPLGSFVGHTDVVWDIRLFPLSISSSQLLASISADGTLKIWDTETTQGSPLKSSWGYNGLGSGDPFSASGVAPTSVDFCPTDLRKVVVSYTNSVVKLFDIETGQAILDFKSNETYGKALSISLSVSVSERKAPRYNMNNSPLHFSPIRLLMSFSFYLFFFSFVLLQIGY